jgi:hypothetical protein
MFRFSYMKTAIKMRSIGHVNVGPSVMNRTTCHILTRPYTVVSLRYAIVFETSITWYIYFLRVDLYTNDPITISPNKIPIKMIHQYFFKKDDSDVESSSVSVSVFEQSVGQHPGSHGYCTPYSTNEQMRAGFDASPVAGVLPGVTCSRHSQPFPVYCEPHMVPAIT